MGNRISSMISKLPNPGCGACHGLGAVRLTAHFYSGDQEWEAPCWQCFGNDVRVQFPSPKVTDN